ncbi:lysostaphin resistance A-like protein [Microbacterium sp. NPDC090218]
MTESSLRVKPRVWIGLVIWVGYIVLVFAIQKSTGIPYAEWGDSAGNLFLGAGVSLIVATVLLAITTSLLRWWRPAMFETQRSHHKWPIFVPILVAVAVGMNLAGTDWSAYSGAFLGASLVLLLVGFTEELVHRGLLLTALRSRLSEVWVWFLSSALFAVMHFVNILLGSPVAGTVSQVGAAFLGGTAFYIVRRVTGSLIWAMVLHGVWDFSVFATGVGTAGSISSVANVVYLLAGILGLAVVWFVFRGSEDRSAPVAAAPAV